MPGLKAPYHVSDLRDREHTSKVSLDPVKNLVKFEVGCPLPLGAELASYDRADDDLGAAIICKFKLQVMTVLCDTQGLLPVLK